MHHDFFKFNMLRHFHHNIISEVKFYHKTKPALPSEQYSHWTEVMYNFTRYTMSGKEGDYDVVNKIS